MLALIVFSGGDVAALDFGDPPEPQLTDEERVREVIADYGARKVELLDIGASASARILAKIVAESKGAPSAVLTPIRAIGFLGRPQAYDAVVPFLKHSNHDVRLAAIRSLGQIAKFDAIPHIEPFLTSADRGERREAVIALGKFAEPKLIPRIEGAASGDPVLDRLAREARDRINATVKGLRTSRFDDLVDVVIDTDEYEDLSALIVVTKFRLLEILSDKTRSPSTRQRAIHILSLNRIRDAGIHMRRLLDDPASPFETRVRAVHGLGLCRVRSAVPQLVALLDHPEPVMRDVCILSLGRIGDARALEPLLAKWDPSRPALCSNLRLAAFRVCSLDESALLAPLRTYQPRSVESVYLISDELALSTGFSRDAIAPVLVNPKLPVRRHALLLLATFGETADSPVLQHYRDVETDSLNREIANLGVERLKNIPIWERE